MGRDGTPYTLDPAPPGAETTLEARARRWWAAAVVANGAAMAAAATGALLASRAVAAWLGLLPILTVPLLFVAPLMRRRGLRRARRAHRVRPPGFPPPNA